METRLKEQPEFTRALSPSTCLIIDANRNDDEMVQMIKEVSPNITTLILHEFLPPAAIQAIPSHVSGVVFNRTMPSALLTVLPKTVYNLMLHYDTPPKDVSLVPQHIKNFYLFKATVEAVKNIPQHCHANFFVCQLLPETIKQLPQPDSPLLTVWGGLSVEAIKVIPSFFTSIKFYCFEQLTGCHISSIPQHIDQVIFYNLSLENNRLEKIIPQHVKKITFQSTTGQQVSEIMLYLSSIIADESRTVEYCGKDGVVINLHDHRQTLKRCAPSSIEQGQQPEPKRQNTGLPRLKEVAPQAEDLLNTDLQNDILKLQNEFSCHQKTIQQLKQEVEKNKNLSRQLKKQSSLNQKTIQQLHETVLQRTQQHSELQLALFNQSQVLSRLLFDTQNVVLRNQNVEDFSAAPMIQISTSFAPGRKLVTTPVISTASPQTSQSIFNPTNSLLASRAIRGSHSVQNNVGTFVSPQPKPK